LAQFQLKQFSTGLSVQRCRAEARREVDAGRAVSNLNAFHACRLMRQ